MRKSKTWIALFLTVLMLMSVLPTSIFAMGTRMTEIDPMSLQPLEEIGSSYSPIEIDLRDQDPNKLDQVPVKTVLEKLNATLDELQKQDKKVDAENSTVAWVKSYGSYIGVGSDNYELPDVQGNMDLTAGYSVSELEELYRNKIISYSEYQNLKLFYTNDPACVYLLLIVGEKANDQTNAESKRFVIKALLPLDNMIMDFSVTEGEDNQAVKILEVDKGISALDETTNIKSYSIYIPRSYVGKKVSLRMDFKASLKGTFSNLEIYEGFYSTKEGIDSEPLPDNTYTDVLDNTWYKKFTAFYKDNNGKDCVSCFSVYLRSEGITLSAHLKNDTIYLLGDYERESDPMLYDSYTYMLDEGMQTGDELTLTMYARDPEFPENNYVNNGIGNIKAAYVGLYSSEEAAAGQTDIKAQLFGEGYKSTGFGEGIFFTVIGNNGEIFHFKYTVTPYVEPEQEPSEPSSDTYFRLTGVNKKAPTEGGETYQTFSSNVSQKTDTMKEIYQTIFILDSEAAIIANSGGYIYPTWYVYSGTTVSWADEEGKAAEERESGKSPLKFEPGVPKLITVKAENGDTRNYYVTFVAQKTEAELYVLGENVHDNNYDETNGMPGREVHLGDLERSETYYDIMFANIGNTPLTDISVSWEGTPQNVAIDDYWTVVEGAELGAFDSVTDGNNLTYGALGNIGKVRLVPIYDEDGRIKHGTISGVLVIKAGDKTVKIKITGIAGTPKIVTETLSDQHAVKWVPYGVMIQSNNVSKADIRFEIDGRTGEAPAGIVLSSGGALYGVPKAQSGEYTFTVQLVYYSDGGGRSVIDSKTFTLNVDDNTDENVWNETDESYDVIQYIGTQSGSYHFVLQETGNQIFSSEGVFNEFVALYLDGERLIPGENYSAVSGSTVVTLFGETIDGINDGESHTIAMEFRTDGTSADEDPTEEVKRAAQNFTVELSGGEEGPGPNPQKPSTPDKPDSPDLSELLRPNIPNFPFTDVAPGDWDYEDVLWAYEKKWMVGISDTLFDPDTPVSQAVIVSVLARMQGVDLTRYEGMSYPGIPDGRWYTTAAIWAKQAGLLPDAEFTEDAPTPRGQLAIMLVKFLRSMGVDVSLPNEPFVFSDADAMTAEEQEAFQILYKLQIFVGIGDMYMAPSRNTSRSEFAALIHRINTLLGYPM